MPAFSRLLSLGGMLLGLLFAGAQPARAGQNDAFAGRLPITAPSAVVVGDVGDATREPDEPVHAQTAGLRSVWWSWTPASDHQAQLSLVGADEEPVALAVYTGAALGELRQVASVQNTADGASPATLAFAARAGMAYALCASLAADIPAERVVLALNQPPLFNIAAEYRLSVGASASLSLAALNAPTSYSTSSLPPGLTFYPSAGLLTGTPLAAGEHWLDLVATNAFGQGSARVRLEIVPPLAPTPAAPSPAMPRTLHGAVGQSLPYASSLSTDGQTTFSATDLPPGVNLHPGTGQIVGTPSSAGIFEAVVTATNAQGSTASPITFVIAASPDSPVLKGPAVVELVLGEALSLNLSPSDTAATLSASALPAGVSLDPTARRLVGTPTTAGRHEVEITATNAAGSTTARIAILVHVSAVRPPEFTHNGLWITELGTTSTFQLTVAQGPATFTVEGLPDWACFNPATATLQARPTAFGIFPLRITATNAHGTSHGIVNLYVGTLTSPRFSPSPSFGPGAPSLPIPLMLSGTVGVAFFYTAPFTEGSTYPTSPAPVMTMEGLPPGLFFDQPSRRITGTVAAAGDYPVVVRYFSNGDMLETITTLAFRPAPPASPPATTPDPASLIIAPLTLTAQVNTSASLSLFTPSTTATFSVSGLPAGLSFSATTGRITGTTSATGVFPLDLVATNAAGTAQARSILQVGQRLQPVFYGTEIALSATVGVSFSNWFTASSSPASYACLETPPPGLTFDTTDGGLEGTPTTPGTYPLTLRATNAAGDDEIIVTVVVRPAEPAKITFPAQLVLSQGAAASRSASSSPSGTTYSASGLPSGLTMSGAGHLSGTPTETGDFIVSITASHAAGVSSLKSNIRVLQANPAAALPVFTSAAGATGVLNSAFAFRLAATNSPTAFTATPLPPGLAFDSATGRITGTPTETGDFVINCGATNAQGNTTARLALRVLAAPTNAPTLTIPANAQLTLGDADARLELQPSNFPDTVTATGLPSGLSINAAGVITGVPRVPGVFTVTVTAANSVGTSTTTFDLAIRTASTAPSLGINSTLQGRVGQPFAAPVLHTPPTGGVLEEIAITGLPEGLVYDPALKAITGTPAEVGVHDLGVLVRTRTAGAYGKVRLTIAAATPPGRPRFTSPAAVSATVGQPFSHTLTATGDVTLFTAVTTLPAWLSLDTATGMLTGTPTSTGNFAYTVRATNAQGARDARLNIAVRSVGAILPPLPLNTPGSLVAKKGDSFAHPLSFANSGAYAAISGFPGVASNLPPAWLTHRTSAATSSGPYLFTISSTGPGGSYSTSVVLEIETPSSITPGLLAPATVRAQANGSVSLSLECTLGSGVFATANLPPGIILSSSGYLSGYSTVPGDYLATITATSGANTATGFIHFTITSTFPSTPPAASAPATHELIVADYVSLTPTLPTLGGSLSGSTYQATGLPPGLYFDPSRRLVLGLPTTPGTYAAKFSVVPPAYYYGSPPLPDPTTVVFVVRPAPITPAAFTSPAEYRGTVGIDFSQILSATNGPIRFAASELPPGLSLAASTGAITGRPTAAGEYLVAATAYNPAGSVSATLRFVVSPDTPPPVIGGGLHAVLRIGEGASHSLSVLNAPTSLSVTGLPPGLALTAAGSISGTPTTPGDYPVAVTATNGGGTSTATILFQIMPADLLDLFWNTDFTHDAGSNIDELILSDSELPPLLQFGAENLPAGLHLNSSTSSIYLRGRLDTPGTYATTFTLSGLGQTFSFPARLNVRAPAPPALSSTAVRVVAAGQPFGFALSGSPSSMTWEASGLPEGVFFHTTNRRLSGVIASPGTHTIPITATSLAGQTSGLLTLVVRPAAPAAPDTNRPFINSSGHVLAHVGAPVAHLFASDNSNATFTVGALPAGLSYDATLRAIVGTPTATGRHVIAVSAHAAEMTESAPLLITIRPYDTRLLTSLYDPRLPSGSVAYVNLPYTDPISTSYPWFPSWTHVGLPPGLNSQGTGGVAGTAASVGEYEFSAILNIASPLAFTRLLAVETTARSAAVPVHAAQAELFPGAPAHVPVSTSQPASLAFSGLPAGLSYSEAQRELVGLVTAPAGTYPVEITATNAHGSVTSRLDLLMRSSLSAPRFTSASAASVTRHESFTYAAATSPAATAFSVEGLPAGLALDPATGRITGRPTQTGDHAIQLTATNAAGSTTLALRLRVLASLAAEPAFTVRANTLWPLGTDRSLLLARPETTGISVSSPPSGIALDATDRLLLGRLLSLGDRTAALTATAGAARPRLVGRDPLLSPPWLAGELEDIVVLAGRPARFPALADGRPAPALFWTLDGSPRVAETDGSLLIASADPALDGAHVALRATNASGEVTSRTATLTVRSGLALSFAEWVAARGLPFDQRGPLDAPAPGATPNLLAYAMDLAPGETFTPTPEFVALPTPVLRLTYRRAKYADGVTLAPQRSADLVAWNADDIATEKLSGDAYHEVWRATVPATGPRVFLRLTATAVP